MVKDNHKETCLESAVVFHTSEVCLRNLKEGEKEYVNDGIKHTLKGKDPSLGCGGAKSYCEQRGDAFNIFKEIFG